MKKLKYGNTNIFYIKGEKGGLLIDTDYSGTLSSFFKAIKLSCIDMSDISYVLATHYHPDHIRLVSELQKLGIKGEIIHTPSHSIDSISLIIDNGACIVGDLEPIDFSPLTMIIQI